MVDPIYFVVFYIVRKSTIVNLVESRCIENTFDLIVCCRHVKLFAQLWQSSPPLLKRFVTSSLPGSSNRRRGLYLARQGHLTACPSLFKTPWFTPGSQFQRKN